MEWEFFLFEFLRRYATKILIACEYYHVFCGFMYKKPQTLGAL